ncbi:hypothetical protein [Aurantiacibacter aquimixticola]|uniref:Uncharacterized protein n=1 Tax=Aurantiacibacter aquimixticola TaxID=1958945 RepID=A0A419RTA8_9SPHN|nr:hypothetical protein [Aurantiacibacter aquimixticola]RJY09006.1 hypothetical protein D6201_06195 [Aurantiacibacter aquimixticola]
MTRATHPHPLRRIGWAAALGVCFALYILLHLKVTAVHADVVRAEKEIVRLESKKLLLETEFLTRSNHVQLAAWNRVDFGFQSPEASQFVHGPRQLATFGLPRAADAPAPIRLAGLRSGEDVPDFPRIVSPLTGEPIDPKLLEGGSDSDRGSIATIAPGPLRLPIAGARSVEVAAR